MDQREFDRAVDRHLPRLRTIGSAFCFTALLYVGIAWLLIEQLEFAGVLELPFAVAAAIAVAQLPVILAGYLIARAIRNPRPATSAAPRDGAGDVEEAMQRYARSVVVGSVLREVASVVGLMLSLFTGELLWVVALAAVALVSMLVHWPRRDAVLDFLQQQRVVR